VVDAPTVDTATEPTLDEAVKNAKAAGAAALVAVTEGPEDYPVQEDIDARAGELGMPVLFVGKRSGARDRSGQGGREREADAHGRHGLGLRRGRPPARSCDRRWMTPRG
jgi:hypothetical protein